MKERPILFKPYEVRAVLDGRMTMTRRVVKPRTLELFSAAAQIGEMLPLEQLHPNDREYVASFSPYGKQGDRLWVREAFAYCGEPSFPADEHPQIIYRAGLQSDRDVGASNDENWSSAKRSSWKPSIHMPRWASRITLEVTGVRVERLQDISDADVWAEGWETVCEGNCNYRDFGEFWQSINGPDSWDANPWVWVIEFKPIAIADKEKHDRRKSDV